MSLLIEDILSIKGVAAFKNSSSDIFPSLNCCISVSRSELILVNDSFPLSRKLANCATYSGIATPCASRISFQAPTTLPTITSYSSLNTFLDSLNKFWNCSIISGIFSLVVYAPSSTAVFKRLTLFVVSSRFSFASDIFFSLSVVSVIPSVIFPKESLATSPNSFIVTVPVFCNAVNMLLNSASFTACEIPTIDDIKPIAPTINAVNGFDKPISFNAAVATPTPPAILAIEATRLSLPTVSS